VRRDRGRVCCPCRRRPFFDRSPLGSHDVAGPEEPEDDGDDRACNDGRQADDEAYEDTSDTDGESDRPDARRREMTLVVSAVRLQ
jgi:hypothetical protein